MRGRRVLMSAALLLAGALGIHELRYLLAFGGEAGSVLAAHGHGYLALMTPVVGWLSALAVAIGLVRAAAAASVRSSASVRVRRVWPAASAALLGIYVSQELLEGLLAPGHPTAVAGVFGAGGWVAVPLALGFGAVVAMGVRVAGAVRPARPRGLMAVRASPAAAVVIAVAAIPGSWRTGRLLADHLAGRAPPSSGCV